MKFEFIDSWKGEFIPVDSWKKLFALTAIVLVTFALTFMIVPFAQWRLHFFQLGIFMAAFVFGPWAGALTGALASSYNGLFVIANPWIIGGNALLGLFSGIFLKKFGPMKAVLAAFAIQLPYLYVTDVYLAHMPVNVVYGIIATLAVTTISAGFIASKVSPALAAKL